MGYLLPGPYQGINSAGQKVTVKSSRIADEGSREEGFFGSIFSVCFASPRYDIATVNVAELPTESRTGAPAPGGSAPDYSTYIVAPQQVGGCEGAMCYKTKAARTTYNCFQDYDWDIRVVVLLV